MEPRHLEHPTNLATEDSAWQATLAAMSFELRDDRPGSGAIPPSEIGRAEEALREYTQRVRQQA